MNPANGIITSAGTAAGLDACLHLLRQELGAEMTNTIARRMVVPPQRDGGQAQFILRPLPEVASLSLSPVTDWMLENLRSDLTVDQVVLQLSAVTGEVERHFADYRFDLASAALYEFAWNTYCDWFLEFAKPALAGEDKAAADSMRHTMLHALEATLRLLHPIIPFITEETRHQRPFDQHASLPGTR